MERGKFPLSSEALSRRRRPGRSMGGWWKVCAGVVFAVAVTVTCVAQDGRPAATGAAGPVTTAQDSKTINATPRTGDPARQAKLEKAAAADSARKKQISDESTQLLAMAVALKAEVDKTNKDVLSLNVIRKADEIEKLARTVKEKMKQGSGPG